MAGDWIKMRHDLRDDPAVIAIASACGICEDTVVGKLHRLWSWADRHTTNGKAPGIRAVWLDKFVGQPGFGEAMASAGWVVFTDAGIEFPKFDIHNGKSAKLRAESTIRQRLIRDSCDKSVTPVTDLSQNSCDKSVTPVTDLSQNSCDKSVTREEKRREEIDTERQTPNPPFGLVDSSEHAESGSPRKTPAHFASSGPNPSDLATVGHSDGIKAKASQNAIKTKSCDVVFPDPLNTQAFVEVWSEWVADRRERRKPITDRAAKTQLAALAKVGEAKAIETIRRSIANGWTGLFPEAIANGAVRGASRTKAEQLDDYFADQVESVLESQIEERNR